MADDIAKFRDNLGAAPGTGDSIVLRSQGTVPITPRPNGPECLVVGKAGDKQLQCPSGQVRRRRRHWGRGVGSPSFSETTAYRRPQLGRTFSAC